MMTSADPAPSASLVAAIAEALAKRNCGDAWQTHLDADPMYRDYAEVAAGVAEPLLREQIAAEIAERLQSRCSHADMHWGSWTPETCPFPGCQVARELLGSAGSAATPETTL